MKIHDLLVQRIFQSKRHTTYECIPELLVTVPAVRSTIVKKIKPLVYLHIFYKYHNSPTGVHSLFLSSCCFCKNYMTLWSFSMTFHDFPWPSLFSMTFQAWKMVFLNSMTFDDFQWSGGTLVSASQNRTHSTSWTLLNITLGIASTTSQWQKLRIQTFLKTSSRVTGQRGRAH